MSPELSHGVTGTTGMEHDARCSQPESMRRRTVVASSDPSESTGNVFGFRCNTVTVWLRYHIPAVVEGCHHWALDVSSANHQPQQRQAHSISHKSSIVAPTTTLRLSIVVYVETNVGKVRTVNVIGSVMVSASIMIPSASQQPFRLLQMIIIWKVIQHAELVNSCRGSHWSEWKTIGDMYY